MSIPPVSGIYTLWAYSTHKSSPAHSHSTAQKQRQGNAYRTQPEYRKRGGQYTISPFALVYSDESYYLLAYDAELKEIRNYRVDRMEKVTGVEGSVREGKEGLPVRSVCESVHWLPWCLPPSIVVVFLVCINLTSIL